MASQGGFSVERLQRFGSEAVRKERRRQEIGHAVTLSCEYLGVSTGEGRFEPAAAAQASHHVGFEWHATAASYTHASKVIVRCDHLAARGVPFPAGWRVALKHLDVEQSVGELAKRVASQSGTTSLRCHFLGQPLTVELSDEHGTRGSIALIDLNNLYLLTTLPVGR